jgi:hypothetical protein
MFDRRDCLTTLAGGAALALGLRAQPVRAADVPRLDAMGAGSVAATGVKLLANAAPIAVPSYRFGVVMRSGIAATAQSGSVTMDATAELVGVTLAALRSIARAAHEDFVAQLAATGRPIMGQDEIRASSGYARLETTPVPFVKKPFADARTAVIVSPPDMPLISLHSDAPLTDKSPFALGNWRAINQMCVDLQCVVLIPNIVIDFAQLSGSGHSVHGGGASVAIRPGLHLVPLFTYVSAHHAKIALAGPMGKVILKDRVAIGQPGEFVKTASHNNRAEVEWWNMTAVNQPDNAGRPTQAYDYSAYEYRVDPAAFASTCLDAARAMNRIYAAPAGQYLPK